VNSSLAFTPDSVLRRDLAFKAAPDDDGSRSVKRPLWKWLRSVADAPAARSLRGRNRQHDDAKRRYRKPYEFKHQRVHSNLPK
jgi:hypothetical protein